MQGKAVKTRPKVVVLPFFLKGKNSLRIGSMYIDLKKEEANVPC
jgi:hypothetical protein